MAAVFTRYRRSGLLAALLSAVALSAGATNHSLWINGREGGGMQGNYADFSYWGPPSVKAGINKKAVNWDGRSRISTQAPRLRDALDCYCTGPNWCYVAADRALMERRAGTVHVSARHPLAAFSEAEWQGEERDRYFTELQRDVDDAQARVADLEARR